jgi:PAS domain S-box-containing protein
MAAVAALILTVLVASSYREWSSYRDAHAAASRSRAILESANDLLTHLLDAETGQRGFLLTGEDRYLQPYNRAMQQIPGDVAKLEKLAAPQAEQESGMRLLKVLVEQRLAEIQRTIALRRTQGAAPALAIVLSDQGKAVMDQIREILAYVRGGAYAEFLKGQQDAEGAARSVLLITGGGSLILLIFTIAGALMLNRTLRQREEAVAEARTARDSLHTTLASIGDGVIATDGQGRVVFANYVALSLLHTAENELLGNKLDDAFHIVNEFTRTRVDSPVAKVLREGTVVGLANHTVLIARDGTEIPIDDSAAPIRGNGTGVQGVVLVFRDVRERRRAERDAAYLEALVRSSDDAVIGKSVDGIIQSWNSGAERLYGYKAEEIIGHPMTDLMPADRAHEESDILEQVRGGSGVAHWETARRRKDGTLVEVALTVSPIRDKTGQVIGASHVARDVTEEKKNAENMRQMQKLESLGVLAGGIAHDFNNLLVGVIGNASLALSELAEDSPVREAIDEVLAAGERAAQLTQQLLAYSGKGRFVLERMDLSAQIRETLPLIHAAIPHNVEMRLDLADGLPAIEADVAQIHQLVMNTIINGAEAIPEGRPGTVTVTTRLQPVDQEYLGTLSGSAKGELEPGTYVLLEIRDTGSGMDEATKARIFDPFFTTKFMGRGLGLSAVLGIVLGHHGSIKVSSIPGLGTTLRVLLPAAEKEVELVPVKPQAKRDLSGSGTVLFVDDEEIVRKLAEQALERNGYQVLLAEDGSRGVEAFRRNVRRVVCVVLDLTMPVMGGEEALARMQAVRSDVPVILSSGFNEAEAVRRFEGKGLAGFLQKPYQTTELLEKVKGVLHPSFLEH